MSSRLAIIALIALLPLARCGADRTLEPEVVQNPVPAPPPTSPKMPPSPPSVPPLAPPAFPPLARAGTVYDAPLSLHDRFNAQYGGQTASRIVLYPEGVFELQFSNVTLGFFAFGGSFVRIDSSMRFQFMLHFDWRADGTLRGDSLRIAYNDAMEWNGFVSGAYVRSTATPVAPPPPTPGPRGTASIYLAESDGSNPKRLIGGAAPSWSPDGAKIAFSRGDSVYVIGTNGSGERNLAKGGWPSWSPDGSRIAFVNDAGISVMNADGSGLHTIVRHDFRDDTYRPYDMGVAMPAWSPRGDIVAFTHWGDGDTQPAQIYYVALDGSPPVRFTDTGRIRYAEFGSGWSPDGSKIAYYSVGYGLAVVGVGDAPRSLRYANGVTSPAWSPDGNAVAFIERQIAADGTWTTTAMIIPAVGGAAKPLVYDAEFVAWSPDGKHIALVSTRVQ